MLKHRSMNSSPPVGLATVRRTVGRARLMLMTIAVASVAQGAGELGPVLRQDAFQIKPPKGFRLARMDLYHGTSAGSVARSASSTRYLSAALVDGEGEDAASVLLSVIDESLTLGPSVRDELATSVVRHLRDELGQPFQLERAEVVDGRVEVTGSIRQGSQLRSILVAAWPGENRHVVALASVPSGRWESVAPSLRESFGSFKLEPVASSGPPARYVGAFAALVAALLLVSVGLWRRRQAARLG